MIHITSDNGKKVLAQHLGETCPTHLRLLKKAGAVFGKVTIILPEDAELREKLENMGGST